MKTSSLNTERSRRNFLKTTGLAAGAAFVLPRFSIGKAGGSANGKLNIAFIGPGNVGRNNLTHMAAENIVALCDIDPTVQAQGKETYTGAQTFTDYREMFDKMGNEIDAVGVATPDHTHFVTAMAAADLGKHLFVQKPLTHNVYELRTLCQKARENELVTQMGNQGHAFEGMRLIKEWYDADALGQVREVIAWTNRPARGWGFRGGMRTAFPSAEEKPEGLNWDLWLGPAQKTGYSSELHPTFWRGWWDFGCGGLGDIGCHTLDIPHWVLGLGSPDKIEVELTEPASDLYTPSGSVVTYHYKRRGKRAAVKVKWYEGPGMPKIAQDYQDKQRAVAEAAGQDASRIDFEEGGVFMVGDKETLFSPGMRPRSPRLADEEAWQAFRRNLPEKVLPRIKGGIVKDWIRAVKGEVEKPCSDFDYAEGLTEIVLLGALAIRTGENIKWDSERMRIKNNRSLERYIKPEPREGWESYY